MEDGRRYHESSHPSPRDLQGQYWRPHRDLPLLPRLVQPAQPLRVHALNTGPDPHHVPAGTGPQHPLSPETGCRCRGIYETPRDQRAGPLEETVRPMKLKSLTDSQQQPPEPESYNSQSGTENPAAVNPTHQELDSYEACVEVMRKWNEEHKE